MDRYCRMIGSRLSLWSMNHRAFQVFNQEPRQNRQSAEELVKFACRPLDTGSSDTSMSKATVELDGDVLLQP